MRKLLIYASAFVALVATYLTGVNNGYDIGADTMQCVVFSGLDLEDQSIKRDACEPVSRWSQHHPAFVLRMVWIKATGQGIPDGAIISEPTP